MLIAFADTTHIGFMERINFVFIFSYCWHKIEVNIVVLFVLPVDADASFQYLLNSLFAYSVTKVYQFRSFTRPCGYKLVLSAKYW